MFRQLTFKIIMMLVTIVVISIIMTATLITERFQRSLMDMSTSHYAFVIEQIRHYVETNLNFGIALTNQQDVSKTISLIRQSYPNILSVEIFDPEGMVLYSTDPSFTGASVSETWKQLSISQQPIWTMSERDVLVVGGAIHRNANNEHMGSIVLRYARDILDQQTSDQASYMAMVSVITVIVIALVIALGLAYLLQSTTADIKNLNEALKGIDKGYDTNEMLDKASRDYTEVVGFATTAVNLRSQIDDANKKIKRLDEGVTHER